MKSDTIAAVATAMSPSGIGIIRLSGDESLEIIDKIYRSKLNNKKISECKSHIETARGVDSSTVSLICYSLLRGGLFLC